MFPLFLLSLYHCDYVSCGLRDEGFLRPLSNTPHGWRSPGAQPQSCRTLAPRLRAWGQSLLLALEPASAEGTLPPASQEPAALLRPHQAPSCISFPLLLSVPVSCRGGSCSLRPRADPTLPAACLPLGSLTTAEPRSPPCPVLCLLGFSSLHGPSCVTGSSSTGESGHGTLVPATRARGRAAPLPVDGTVLLYRC